MQETIAEISSYLQSATRFKWWGLTLVWVVCLSGWVVVSMMPDVYKAEARIHVDTRSVLRPLLSGLTIQPDISGQIRLMSKLLFTRPNLEKVARMTDLDLGAKDDKAMEKLVKRLQESLTISEAGGDNLFSIGANHADPKTAKKIVQSLLTIFVEETLGGTRDDRDSAKKFIDQQIKEYEERLVTAEQAREEFKRTNYALLPEHGGDLYTQLNKVTEQLEQSKLDLQEAIDRRDDIQRQLRNEEPMLMSAEGDSQAPADPIDLRIQNLQSKLDELLLRYTANHPAAVALKRSIADLEKQKVKEKTVAEQAGIPAKGAESNPIYQQIKIVLGEAEADVASLTTRVKSSESKIEELKKQMDDRLKVETQMQSLSRDYDSVKKNYEELLKRRESARLSENVEQNTDAVKFKIVDPPQVPFKPAAPNRILLSSVVLLASLAIGAGLAIFLSMLRPSFNSIQKLRDITGRAVLGTVSMNWMPEIQASKRRELYRFVVALGVLIFLYTGIIVLEIKGINLRHLPV
ncbi:MAG: hypothetical protein PHE55_20880 [Methylococcaceae bacterium]|nr:hypothetical protein [Methylococcaceae bacterium]